jgi:hypothetical protein
MGIDCRMTAIQTGWADEPLRRFVNDAGVSLAVLAHTSGRLMAQAGFARATDVRTACVLAAAANATRAELGKLVDGSPFTGLHYAGARRQTYLATSDLPQGSCLLLAVFDDNSSLGLVRLCLEELQRQLVNAAPQPGRAATPARMENFERDLNESLALAFGEAS